MFAATQTTKGRTHKKTQEPANPEIFLFLTSQKTSLFDTFCVRERSAEIFPEIYMFGTK